jgi:hypothetical protein
MTDAIITVINALFRTGESISNIIGIIEENRQQAEATKDQILYETWINMSLIFDDYLKEGAITKKIVNKLKIEDLASAIREGYNFKNIKKNRITKTMTGGVKFFEPYVRYDCKDLLMNIRFHIDKLKLLYSVQKPKNIKKIDVRKRLINLGKRYLLFTKLLASQ